ncbi:hypothetical protein [Hymenobacter rigui]|uniref:Outer membrane protein beta-barrel domain-containing protein n=1 Tax=Hymenobacter rigui TaxID=334424 RepID=A0A3R9N0L6_9BACT|nr:hypothetical protein [Hymenobacter rigui]RSK45244.1 hypothetical protein EI291_19220 [Hymenobacter rigui]
MKRHLFLMLISGAGLVGLAPTVSAQTTDTTRTVKPQLNTAPPGSAPAPTAPPVYQPAPVQAPVPDRNVPASNAPYDPSRPSGMDLPQRPGVAAPAPPLRRYFLYTNFGLGFNSYNGYSQFSGSLAPAIGYRFTERFAAGPGISYAYNSYSFSGLPTIKTNSIGLKAFAQFIAYKEFFLHAEYEVTNAETLGIDYTTNTVFTYKHTVRTPLAGAGYRTRFSDRAAADIVVLYNFNDGFDDIYGQPVIRFSFLFDLK